MDFAFIAHLFVNYSWIISVFLLRYFSYYLFLKKYKLKKIFFILPSVIYPVLYFFIAQTFLFDLRFGFPYIMAYIFMLLIDFCYFYWLIKTSIKEVAISIIKVNIVYLLFMLFSTIMKVFLTALVTPVYPTGLPLPTDFIKP